MLRFLKLRFTGRKQAEEDSSRLAAIVDSSDDAIIGKNLDGIITSWNKGAEKIYGYSAKEAIGKPISFLIPPGCEDEASELLAKIRSGEPVHHYETMRRRKDGRTIHLSVTISPVRNAEGLIVGASSIGREITEQKRAEELLRESEERYRLAMEATSDGVWDWDLVTDDVYYSPAYFRMLGYDPEEFQGKANTWLHLIHPEDRERALAANKACIRNQSPSFSVEFRMRSSDGSWRWILGRGKAVRRDANGHALQMIGTHVDITASKQAEEALRESEEKFSIAFRHAPIMAALSSLEDGTYIDVNDKFLEVLGLEREEVIGRSSTELGWLTAEDRKKVIDIVNKEGRLSGVEISSYDKNGKPVECLYHCNVVSIGGIRRLLTTVLDVTARKQAEQAVRESRERLSQILDFLPEPTFAIDLEGKVIVWNKAYEQMTGVKAEDILGKGDYEYALPFYGRRRPVLIDAAITKDSETLRNYSSARREGDILLADAEATLKGGEIRVLSCKARPLYDSAGTIIGAIESIRDVTEIRKTQDMLQDSEKRYRSVVENMQDVFYRTDKDNIITMISPSAAKILGIPCDKITGRRVESFWMYPSEREKMMERLRRDGFVRDYEITLRKIDGSPVIVSDTSSLLKDEQGQILGIEGLLRDITERKRGEEERQKLQAQLNQAQKLESVGRLAGGVAHDFNNMLGLILGHAELALKKVDQSHALSANLTEIRKAALRSADLTRQLLAFARKQTISPKVLDLNQTVEGMLKMLRRLIGEDIDLTWLPAADPWPVKVDPGQIDQILANLCVNARDAISGVGKVTIETGIAIFDEEYCAQHSGFVPGEFVMLAVSDDGCGMDKQTLGNIFEPFYTTKAFGEGTGLGLATVYGIVKQNNGFINVYSEPGRGTTFKIYIPRAEKLRTDRAPVPMKKELRGSETVLLVEDEEPMLDLGTTILQEHGYRVLATQSPAQALAIARRHSGPIHLLITDVVMPEMNGKELRDRLAEVKPGVKNIFMSGYTANVIAHHGILGEGIDFLQKPFSIQTLLEKVRNALDR